MHLVHMFSSKIYIRMELREALISGLTQKNMTLSKAKMHYFNEVYLNQYS